MTDLESLKKQISELKSKAPTPDSDSEAKRIYQYCIHLLAKQDYSEYKLRQKLRSKPQNLPHVIDEAIEKIKTNGLLREEAYRRLFIRKWMLKGESEDKIRKRGALEKLIFQEEEFKNCSEELGLSDQDSLEKLITKKLRSKKIPAEAKERYKLQDKVLRFLISKGHGYEESKREIQRFITSKTPDLM
jgi:regulatory protein